MSTNETCLGYLVSPNITPNSPVIVDRCNQHSHTLHGSKENLYYTTQSRYDRTRAGAGARTAPARAPCNRVLRSCNSFCEQYGLRSDLSASDVTDVRSLVCRSVVSGANCPPSPSPSTSSPF